ncbi:polysaccharide deacetylase family protein [Curvibacter sp. CHRR-16]|uniref:polysaccharide deacetylase family protein n=1 Tax=Curvibacter sp. CHRR-16 TaxID=2835872 RepID=UPI001BDB2401|nr:polysaccharide deacetylase family protein [Curvibacter sp. CHRR-16]MBT0568961.1 polysaccharide deacetylase family protein [Curvibacter sp. CHRR-16]
MQLLTASTLAVHGAALGLVWAHSAAWPVAAGAVVANHAFLAAGGLLPRVNWLGPNITRLPEPWAQQGCVGLTLDDGPHPEHTPQVLDMLDAAGAQATFFCIGQRVLQYPALAREIVARGHHIENHTQHHYKHFSLLGPKAMEREIVSAQRSIADTVGRMPQLFRAVAGLRNLFLQPILERHQLQLVSWTRRPYDTVCADPTVVLQRLSQRLQGGDIVLLHDGPHMAHTDSGQALVLAVLPKFLQTLQAHNLRSVVLSV